MTDLPVIVDRADAVATVTLNRPDRRNALTRELKEALAAALDEVAADTDVRAVVLDRLRSGVLRGAGPRRARGSARARPGDGVRDCCAALLTDRHRARDHAEAGGRCGQRDLCRSRPGLCPRLRPPRLRRRCHPRDGVLRDRADLRLRPGEHAPAGSGGGARPGAGAARPKLHPRGGRALGDRRRGRPGRRRTRPRRRRPPARLAAGPTLAYAESKRLLAAGLDRSLADTLGEEAVAQARLGLTRDHVGAVNAFLARERPMFVGE